MEYSSFCCVLYIGSGLCDELVTHSEESSCVCMCVFVFLIVCLIYKPQQTVTVALSLAAAPQKIININFTYRHSISSRLLLAARQCGSFSPVGPFIAHNLQSAVRVASHHILTGIIDRRDNLESLHYASLLRSL